VPEKIQILTHEGKNRVEFRLSTIQLVIAIVIGTLSFTQF
jgi:hypothetical protein